MYPFKCEKPRVFGVKIAQQDGALLQEKVHLANQVKLQLAGD